MSSLKVEGGGDVQLDPEGYDGTDFALICCPMSPTASMLTAISPLLSLSKQLKCLQCYTAP